MLDRLERSLAKFDASDLKRLADIAARDRARFFARNPRWGTLYRDRLIAVALCQGGALHFVNGINGVKDLDVWAFYAEHPEAPLPWRRRGKVDYGASKFGRHPDDHELIGRRVDLLARSIAANVSADPVSTVQKYLQEGNTESARALQSGGVVLLEPEPLRGQVAWPIGAGSLGFDAGMGAGK